MKRLLPRWVRENFLVKAGMLLLAALLWFLVITEKAYEDTFAIPIAVNGIPKGMTPAVEIPKTALVRFHGRAKELIRLHYVSPPHFNLDIGGISERRVIKPKPESVIIPGGMNVTVIEILKPDSIITIMENYAESERPVKLDLDLKCAPGYTMFGEPEITPRKVLVSGPEKAVANIKEILSERMELNDLSRTTEIIAKLLIPNDKGVHVNFDKITVTLHIERLGERELAGIPLRVEHQPQDGKAHIEPTNVKVTFKGSVSTLAQLEVKDINAWVNCAEFEPSRPGWLPVHVETPIGTGLTGINPPRIRVTIRK